MFFAELENVSNFFALLLNFEKEMNVFMLQAIANI